MAFYDGPIFDVQTHAIMPDTVSRARDAIERNESLTTSTKEIMANDICTTLADNLTSALRKMALDNGTVHVVSVNTFFPRQPPSQLLSICDRVNIWMAKATAVRPELIGIATLAPPPQLAREGAGAAAKGLDLLEKAITTLGLKGALMASNYDNIFLGDALFDPYYALLERLNMPLIIHPAVRPVEEHFITRKNIGGLSGFLNDQRTTLLDLVMAGVLERYPRLKIIATHLGGGILSSLGRFEVVSQRFPHELWYIDEDDARPLLPRPIASYLSMIYYDCNNADVDDIKHAISKVGIDHLLTGTDFPWTDDQFARKALGQVQDERTRLKVAYNNAAHLFSRPEFSLLEHRTRESL